MRIYSVNPATENFIMEYDPHGDKQVENIIRQSQEFHKGWTERSAEQRASLLNKLAVQLEQQKDDLAELITSEMGKAIRESQAEIDKCALLCRYYAENGPKFLEDIPVDTDASKSYVTWNSLGPVLAVMPWNFPFWQVFRFAAPALMAGNPVLLKHAENVPGCAIQIQELFSRAGFADGALQNLFIDHKKTAELIADKRVAAVTLTGSTKAGKAVAAQAGAHLKKTVLELGGSDPYIILKDAPLEKTVEACVTSRLLNAGQSCIAAKRFIVEDAVYERFLEAFTEKMRSKTMGDPMSDDSDIGPQAREDLRNKLHKQVQHGLIDGAKDVLGCKIPTQDGFYYPPSVITEVRPGMNLFDEEIFGPVAAISIARDENDAIELANHSDFGLGAAIFTSDVEKGEAIASRKIQAGSCFVNDFVKSDPRLPFGGIRESGYGRELSWFGMREFMNIKTISIK